MDLRKMYFRYQSNSSKLSFCTLLIGANVLLFILLLIVFLLTLDIVILSLLFISLIGFIVIFTFAHKLKNSLRTIYKSLEMIQQEKSCIFTNSVKMNIPSTYNIIDNMNTSDGFILYKCKNQDNDYTFLEQAVKNIDHNNNMLTLIDFTDISVGAVITVEYIMKNGLCIIKDDKSKMSLTDLANITLKGVNVNG